jgi:hypothetical protein
MLASDSMSMEVDCYDVSFRDEPQSVQMAACELLEPIMCLAIVCFYVLPFFGNGDAAKQLVLVIAFVVDMVDPHVGDQKT